MNRSAVIAATCAIAAGAGVWESKRPMPEGAAGGAAGVLENQIVYAGGTTWRDGKKLWLSRAIRYDFHKNAWTDAPALPESLGYGASVSHEDTLEVFGGLNDSGVSRKTWLLRKGAKAWEQTGLAPISTALGRAAVVGNQVFLFGGCSDAADLGSCSDHVYARDRSGAWQKISVLPGGAVALSAVSVAGSSVLLFGGCKSTGAGTLDNLAESWRFDAVDSTWHHLRALPQAVRGISAIALADGSVLLAGGYQASQAEAKLHGAEFGFSSSVWRYDPKRDQYSALPALPLGLSGPELLMWNGTAFAFGGEDRARSRNSGLFAIAVR